MTTKKAVPAPEPQPATLEQRVERIERLVSGFVELANSRMRWGVEQDDLKRMLLDAGIVEETTRYSQTYFRDDITEIKP